VNSSGKLLLDGVGFSLHSRVRLILAHHRAWSQPGPFGVPSIRGVSVLPIMEFYRVRPAGKLGRSRRMRVPERLGEGAVSGVITLSRACR